MRIATMFLVLVSLTAPATASEVISFDEVPAQNDESATLGEEYAHLGVHFTSTDDGAIWDGMSHGDPGGWELEGSNGPSFVGFNGSSYELTASFDAPVSAFSIDVSAASGADPGGTFALLGYRAGALVETTSVTLGGLNQWMTVGLNAVVDQVVFVGDTRGYYPLGADNMHWELYTPPTTPPTPPAPPAPPTTPPTPPRLDVSIDVRPGSTENPVNPGSNGLLPVALLGSESFDVTNVDPDSLALGVNGAFAVDVAYADADGDGWMDLVANYSTPETGTAYGDTSICLTGATLDGVELAGCDAIRTVPHSPATAQKTRRR